MKKRTPAAVALAIAGLSAQAMAYQDTPHHGHHQQMTVTYWPEDGSVLTQSPDKLIIAFDHPMQLSALQLTFLTGERIALEMPGETLTRFEIPLPVLDADDYTVSWQAKGKGDHAMTGQFRFTVE